LFGIPQQAIDGHVNAKLVRVLDTGRDFVAGKGPVPSIENHDHSTLVNRAGGRDRWWKAQVPLVVLFTSHGAVLIHNNTASYTGLRCWSRTVTTTALGIS